MTKNDLRKKIRSLRDNLPPDLHDQKSRAICRHLLDHPGFVQARSVFLTLPFGSEWDTQALIHGAWTREKTVLIPICLPGNQLGLAHYTPTTPMATTAMGIQEVAPGHQHFFNPKDLDFCLVPGLVFDLQGGRIGYGGGYYDRLLPSLPASTVLVAGAFDLQVLTTSLPRDPHDIKVPELWTESGRRFGPSPRT